MEPRTFDVKIKYKNLKTFFRTTPRKNVHKTYELGTSNIIMELGGFLTVTNTVRVTSFRKSPREDELLLSESGSEVVSKGVLD